MVASEREMTELSTIGARVTAAENENSVQASELSAFAARLTAIDTETVSVKILLQWTSWSASEKEM